MKEQLLAVLSRVVDLLEACGEARRGSWFRERLETLGKEPVESEKFQAVIREIKGIIAGMGSFVDLHLEPKPGSGLSVEKARMLQWDLADELSDAIGELMADESASSS